MMKKKDKNKSNKPKIGLWKCIKKVVPFHIKVAPWLYLSSSLIIALQTVCSSLRIYALENMTNRATALAVGEAVARELFIAIAVWGCFMLIPPITAQLANKIDIKLGQKATNAYAVKMYRKHASLEPIAFEDTNNLEDIEKANNGMGAAKDLVSILRNLFLNVLPYLIVVSLYLIDREPLLVLAMVIMFLPTILQQYAVKKLYDDHEDKQAPLRRKQGHYNGCITANEYFKETRLLGGYKYFIRNFSSLFKTLVKNDLKAGLKTELLYFLTTLVSLIGKLVVYYMLFRFLMVGRISVGEFSAVFLSLGQIENSLHNLFYNTFSNIAKKLPYIENYIRFIDFPESRSERVELPEEFPITLNDVKFKYPNQEGYALDGVSFSVKPKETVAIVGENGSGKSTLIKLISGYYVPESGDVTIDGHSTKVMSYSSVARRLSAVFQRFPHYALTLRENMIIADPEKEHTDEAMYKACEMAGFSPDDEWLPNGLDTMLSREFDGVGLSGGQIQRVAIARAFYRDSSMIVLDEPTAAIDPIEEARIYSRFAELSKDKMSFIVTHRLASVKIADRIIMMKSGKAVEIGSHDELMALNGEYRKMYDSQRQWYEAEQ